MCMSGIHYLEEEIIKEEIIKEEIIEEENNNKVNPKYICYYSNLPSVLNYQEEDDDE